MGVVEKRKRGIVFKKLTVGHGIGRRVNLSSRFQFSDHRGFSLSSLRDHYCNTLWHSVSSYFPGAWVFESPFPNESGHCAFGQFLCWMIVLFCVSRGL